MVENLQEEVINFIKDPGNSSFENVYQNIYSLCQFSGNQELKNTIINIINFFCDKIIYLPALADESNIDLMKRRIDEFTKVVVLLSNLFSYYDSLVDKGEKTTDIAIQTILTKYLSLEFTVTTIQKDVSYIFNSFFRSNTPIPESTKLVSLFINTVNPDLYKRIFETTISNEVNLYFQTLNIESMNPFERITFLYDVYTHVSASFSTYLQPSTTSLFKELFCKGVMKKDNLVDSIISEDVILSAPAPSFLGQLFFLAKLGPTQWESTFSTHFCSMVKTKLDTILRGLNGNDSSEHFGVSDKFADFSKQVSALLVDTQGLVRDFLDNSEAIHRSVMNNFSRFLRGQNFTHELCVFLDKSLSLPEFMKPLCAFVRDDPSFEENFGLFMTHRLLLRPDTEKESQLLLQLKDAEIELERPRLMLEDFVKAPKTEAKDEQDGCQVSIVMLHKFCWPSLQVPEFDPPKLFVDMFNSSLKKMDFDESRKIIRVSDRYSSVEFGNGETSFSLPFFHACILQTVLEKGQISEDEICQALNLKNAAVKEALKNLTQSKILTEDDQTHLLSFCGPPTAKFSSEGSTGDEGITNNDRLPEEPLLYTNCNDQIDAAILRFLKQKRFAQTKEIKEAVYSMIPNKFPVTDAKIEACLQKLFERELIMHHGGNSDSYRYCRH